MDLAPKDLACPICAAPMVRRHRRSDGAEFLGCSRFPVCRGTRQLAARKSVVDAAAQDPATSTATPFGGPIPDRAQAGSSARAEFARRRDRRREQVAARLPRIVARSVLIAVVGLAMTQAGPTWQLLGWALIAIAALSALVEVFVLPGHVRAWDTGAEGEGRTGRLLQPLEADGFRILHDRKIPGSRANIDHIVIGPPGTFVVETKSYAGSLKIRGGDVYVAGRRKTGMIDEAKREAAAVEAALTDELAAHGLTVTPIICVHRAELPWFKSEVAGVRIVSGKDLVRRLRKADRVLSPADIERLVALAEERLRPAVVAPPVGTSPAVDEA